MLLVEEPAHQADPLGETTAPNPGPAEFEQSISEVARPEPHLMRLLRAKAQERGHTLRQQARALDVTPGYITQLRNGNRNVHQISRTFACACARYLDTSVVSVLLMAQALSPPDFVSPSDAAAERRKRLLSVVLDDPVYGTLTDAQMLLGAPQALQSLVVQLYAGLARAPADAGHPATFLSEQLDGHWQPAT